jgi:hypothetical protein
MSFEAVIVGETHQESLAPFVDDGAKMEIFPYALQVVELSIGSDC